jgi:membrane-associated phospholipid phosphatase
LACCLVAASACGTLPNGGRWGDQATFSPGWHRVGAAARRAVSSPSVWIPAAGAGLFLIGEETSRADSRLSDWASSKTPLFGSPATADRASDRLQNIARGAGVVTSLVTPGGRADGARWLTAKGRGIVAGSSAVLGAFSVTHVLKESVERQRPDASDPDEANKSFPSGHSSHTAVFSTMASRNVDHLPWPRHARTVAKGTFAVMTAATMWSRVEAKQHYPSDVLAGAAIGNFFGAFVYDAFLGLGPPGRATVTLQPSPVGSAFSVTVRFALRSATFFR